MSDRRSHYDRDNVREADQFSRCALCWRWFDRSDPKALAGHRGPLPHAVAARCTAWADEDE